VSVKVEPLSVFLSESPAQFLLTWFVWISFNYAMHVLGLWNTISINYNRVSIDCFFVVRFGITVASASASR